MKRFSLFCAVILAAIAVHAGVIIGPPLGAITTAYTNSTTLQTNTATITLPQVTMSNNALSATNTSYAGLYRWSFDGANWYTNGSPVTLPASASAGSTVVAATTIQVPVQVQFVAYTNTSNTSTINFGATSP